MVAADNGIDGLVLVREYKPDLVISDIHMPGMDGFAMLQGLRANAALMAPRYVAHCRPRSKHRPRWVLDAWL